MIGSSKKLSSPLEKGRAKGAGWMCRVAAPFYVAESMPSISDVLPSISHFPFLILQNSASSRQSIPCPSGTPFFKGGRALRLFQYSAALLIFMRRTTIPHSSFLIPHSSFEQSFQTELKGAPPHRPTLNSLHLFYKRRLICYPSNRSGNTFLPSY